MGHPIIKKLNDMYNAHELPHNAIEVCIYVVYVPCDTPHTGGSETVWRR